MLLYRLVINVADVKTYFQHQVYAEIDTDGNRSLFCTVGIEYSQIFVGRVLQNDMVNVTADTYHVRITD